MVDSTLINTRAREICFTLSYIIQIKARDVRGCASQFDPATDQDRTITHDELYQGCNPGNIHDNDVRHASIA